MATTFEEVSTYTLTTYGGPSGGGGGMDGAIKLKVPSGTAFLRFYPEGATIPNNSKVDYRGQGVYNVSYRARQFGDVVDLLRNEKPIKFYFNDEMLSYLTTNPEPVGEEED
jgi:hypothetical protein